MKNDGYAMLTTASFIIMKTVFNNTSAKQILAHLPDIYSFILSAFQQIYSLPITYQVLLGAGYTICKRHLVLSLMEFIF